MASCNQCKGQKQGCIFSFCAVGVNTRSTADGICNYLWRSHVSGPRFLHTAQVNTHTHVIKTTIAIENLIQQHCSKTIQMFIKYSFSFNVYLSCITTKLKLSTNFFTKTYDFCLGKHHLVLNLLTQLLNCIA